ncbi:hypothetical protein ACWDA7_19465 [Streptomyces sp. NPDC001156]
MTAYDRLMAEALPTGTFGDAVPPKPPPPEPLPSVPRWTPDEQTRHRADLEHALDGWRWDDDPRHLRLITDHPDQTAA